MNMRCRLSDMTSNSSIQSSTKLGLKLKEFKIKQYTTKINRMG